MRARIILYWATTLILAFALLSGGVAELMHRRETIQGMLRLGYPVYFIMILGFWKILGAATLLAPRVPRLKEWAYAGVFFNMTGAVVSHIVSGDSIAHTIAPAIFAALTVVSWALRPQSRILGAISAPGSQSLAGYEPAVAAAR